MLREHEFMSMRHNISMQDELEYVLQPGDSVTFISTLHGG